MEGQKEDQTNCEHDWMVEREARTTIGGHLPALWKCKKCSLTLTTSEVKDLGSFQKEQSIPEKRGQLPGVSIFARKIENEGEISSEGPGARTEIITEDYSGSGVIKSKNTSPTSTKKWHEKPWGVLILGIIASAIVTITFYFLK